MAKRSGIGRAVLIVVVLVAAVAGVIYVQQSDTPDPAGNLEMEEFLRIAQSDGSLDDLEEGQAFSETVDASESITLTYEIPAGMTIYVRGQIFGGQVDFRIDPVWTDPRIVEYREGQGTRALITNESPRSGRVTVIATPIGDVTGDYTLYGE